MDDYAPRRPHPVKLLRTLRPHEVDLHRRAGCRHYLECLDRSARQQWLSFTCVRCFAFRPHHLDKPDWNLQEILRLLADGFGNRLYSSTEEYLACHRGPDRVQV